MAMSELKQRIYKYELSLLGFKDTAYLPEAGKIKTQANDERMPIISDNGDIHYGTEHSYLVMDTIGPLVNKVNEMVAAWEKSRPMPFEYVSEFNILAEYNGAVLAARDDAECGRGLYFATWKYDSDGMGVSRGFYTIKYDEAKESFALRSGLVKKERLMERGKTFSEKLDTARGTARQNDTAANPGNKTKKSKGAI